MRQKVHQYQIILRSHTNYLSGKMNADHNGLLKRNTNDNNKFAYKTFFYEFRLNV